MVANQHSRTKKVVKSCFDDIKRDLSHTKTVIEKVKIFERLLGFRQCKCSLRPCPASSHHPEEKPNQYTQYNK